MSNRKKTSGGQAIVMVSLALISMSGMMGLAVDLGWSFFTQKAAQAAADDAALSAVQSAYGIIVQQFQYPSWFSFCSDTGQVACKPTPVPCDANLIQHNQNNLWSGCLYAKNDGFVPGGHGGRQNVLIQANMPSVAFPDSIPNPPGSPKDMVYWVTVRTYESIPQLFSFVNGKQNGAIAAVATAAIASKVLGGSFYGMNRPGDCFVANGNSYCGVDLVSGASSGACPSGPSAFLCAPGGAYVASTCNGGGNGCSGNSNYAGTGSMNGGPAINTAVTNALDPTGTWTPAPTVTPAGGYQDPTQGEPQPPLAASTAIPSCGIGLAGIPPHATLGPFQYYHYSNAIGNPQPDGAPIALPSDATFAANGTCPGKSSLDIGLGGTPQTSSAFPLYVFYGGLDARPTTTITFGPGQYVMAGVVNANTPVFNVEQANLITAGASGDNYSGSGNLFILTNPNYPGLAGQIRTVPNNALISGLQFGSASLEGGTGTTDLFGMAANSTTGTTDLPTNLNGYGGTLIWQDRANSTVTYNANGKVMTDPNGLSLPNSNCPSASCKSPELLLNNLQNLHGLIYQPRGAWTRVAGPVSTSPLQMLTGAIVGSGFGSLQLTSPVCPPTIPCSARPGIRYLPVLIQ